jgi:hypothetical protein
LLDDLAVFQQENGQDVGEEGWMKEIDKVGKN